ncbi:hypothetical protein D3C76_1259600 [compost metagenome]
MNEIRNRNGIKELRNTIHYHRIKFLRNPLGPFKKKLNQFIEPTFQPIQHDSPHAIRKIINATKHQKAFITSDKTSRTTGTKSVIMRKSRETPPNAAKDGVTRFGATPTCGASTAATAATIGDAFMLS